jgi:hypothetical protein
VAPGVGVAPDLLDDVRDLVNAASAADSAAVRGRPGAPLPAVDRPELAVLVRPFVPDRHAVLAEVGDVGAARQEPEELVDDGADVKLFRGQQGEALREVEAHLIAEDAQRAGPGPVRLLDPLLQDVPEEVQILPHGGAL